MAVGLSWKGYVDTDFNFSEFFEGAHTLSGFFMPQYPLAYEGPVMGEKGDGTYVAGQGYFNYDEGKGKTQLYLAVGGESRSYAVSLVAGQWYHLAVVAAAGLDARAFTMYLNGQPVGTPLIVKRSDPELPKGTLRFGRRTSGAKVNTRDAQFFGLIHSAAVYTRALSQAEVFEDATKRFNLTGNESGLLAGYQFSGNPSHPRLNRFVKFTGPAVGVDVLGNNDADKNKFLLPTKQQEMDLPFAIGDVWRVVKSYETDHHSGYASFTWDFIIDAEQKPGDMYPNGTGNAPIFAAAGGEAAWVRESEPSGTPIPNLAVIRQASGEFCEYIHLGQNGVDLVEQQDALHGQKVAIVHSTGLKDCHVCHHLHLGMTDRTKDEPGLVTFPVAFSDYQVKNGTGWINMPRGIPAAGQVLRIPPTPVFQPQSLRPSSAISRSSNSLDVFATDVSGAVWTARWRAGTYARNWDRWRRVLPDIGGSGLRAEVVSRHDQKLDIFATGSDRIPYTGAWEEFRNNAQWQGWWKLPNLALPDNAPVTAVSRHPDMLDIFAVGADGGVYTAAWDRNQANEQWRGWWRIGDLKAPLGTRISAVARDENKLDIFVVGGDGKVYTAAWDVNMANQQWRGWWTILDAHVPPGGNVTAISRHPNKLDVFIVGSNQGAFTAAWEGGVNNSQWSGWWRIGDEVFIPGLPITPVSRHPDKLDVFVAGNDGRVWTAAWEVGLAGHEWKGWWTIGDGQIAGGSAVAAASRGADKLDVFAMDPNGVLHTAAWDGNVANAQWQGWWRIG